MRPERHRKLRRVLESRQPDLTVLMERVNKAHNFSAILRNCDAVGVLQVHAVVTRRGIDLDPQTSAGTGKWIDVVEHDTIGAAADALHAGGFSIIAAHPGDGARDYRDLDLTAPTAFMMGAELDGISPAGLALADEVVVIPMIGMAQSLNVSVATALLLFEAFRQRDAAGMHAESRIPPEDRERILFEWGYPRIAQRLRNEGRAYPALDERGAIVDPLTTPFSRAETGGIPPDPETES